MTNQEFIINSLIELELQDANDKFAPFHTAHEGYAVLKEEVEETQQALECVDINMDSLWSLVKSKRYEPKEYLHTLENIDTWGIEVIKEAIQVVAIS